MSEADDDDVPELVDAPSSSDEEDLDSDTVPVHKKSGKPTAQQMKSKAEEMKMTRKAEADVLKIEGNELVSRQQYAEACKIYTKAIALDSENSKLYSNRALCHEKCGQYIEASRDAELCIKYDKDWPRGYLRKGNALHRMNELHKALEAFRFGKKCAESLKGEKYDFATPIGEICLKIGKALAHEGNFTNEGNNETALKYFEEGISMRIDTSNGLASELKEARDMLKMAVGKLKELNQTPASQSAPQSLAASGGPKSRDSTVPSAVATAAAAAEQRMKDNMAAAAAAEVNPLDEKQRKLKDADDLQEEARIAEEQKKYTEAIDKHDRSLQLRISAMGDAHSITSCNRHELGRIFLFLGMHEEAHVQLERAYTIRRKKKGVEPELRWTTAFYLGLVHKGSTNFDKALELFSKCEKYFCDKYFDDHHGNKHHLCLSAAREKKSCVQMETAPWRLVKVCKLTGDKARHNDRHGRFFMTLNCILMFTGEEMTSPERQNYGYLEEEGLEYELPPELLPHVDPPEKLATCGIGSHEGAQPVADIDELGILREMRSNQPNGGAKVLYKHFQKQYPNVQMSLSRIRKLLKDIEAEGAKVNSSDPSGEEHGCAIVSEADARQEVIQKIKESIECPLCMETYDDRRLPMIVPSCGHSVCRSCVEVERSARQCSTCKAKIHPGAEFLRNWDLQKLASEIHALS